MNWDSKQFLLFPAFILLIFSDDGIASSYIAKAEQVYRFAVYVHWAKNKKPLTFCVRGNQSFKRILKKRLATKKRIAGRQLKVGQASCNIIVGISQSVQGGKGVLTISDTKAFAKNGGMIEFVSANGRNFHINNKVAKENKVNINAHLLKLAKEVYQ